MKKLSLLIIVLLSLTSFVLAHAGDNDTDFGHYGMMGTYGMMSGNYGLGWMFFGWIVGILWIAILILVVVWLIKQIQKK